MSKNSKNSINFCEETIFKKHLLEVGWIELCARLKEIRDKELYLGRWDSFEDFLNDPSMAMDKSTASKMITIQERLILDYKISPAKIAEAGGWSKVAEILPAIKDKKSAEEWLSNATYLSKSDLRKKINEERDGKGIECKHKNSYQITMQCCRDCGNKEVIKGHE